LFVAPSDKTLKQKTHYYRNLSFPNVDLSIIVLGDNKRPRILGRIIDSRRLRQTPQKSSETLTLVRRPALPRLQRVGNAARGTRDPGKIGTVGLFGHDCPSIQIEGASGAVALDAVVSATDSYTSDALFLTELPAFDFAFFRESDAGYLLTLSSVDGFRIFVPAGG